ncbi:MAG: MBL fold metallo-hydrolase [Myxococcales bacterium]|nr:MBL fold metallo-hydrolase [Myxococcales bacterium]MCB9549405.1 MBL fold metallo-hydrolase [Myxococcales bacterium]
MQVKFWGVRGSIAVSGARFARTGGNTTCVEVQAAGHRLILDGGTGLRALGEELGFQPIQATLLFTHLHWDHIQGVPFFTPAFHPGSDLTFVGAERTTGGIRDALALQMRPPQFPVGLGALVGARRFTDVQAQKPFEIGPFRITGLEQDHPDGVVAWRIEAEGRTLVFATDIEHGGRIDPGLRRLATGADLLVHDAQYTSAEYAGQGGPPRRGWGHSTWEEAVQVCQEAGAARLGLFHHDPTRDDDALAILEHAARSRFSGAFAAREGQQVAL